MPSALHEILVEMFRERPALAAELLYGPLQIAVPEFREAQLSAAELTDVVPTEYRADAVVTLNNDGTRLLAIAVEVQLRTDPRKRRTWPAYAATLYARMECPAVVMVICPNGNVAKWCAAPIVFGPPGSVLTPVVLGPDQVPILTEVEAARRTPELAVLSALAHGARADPTPVFGALLAALEVFDHDRADLYTDLVLTVLPEAARESLENFMTTMAHRYQSDFARRYYDRGEAEGQARGEAKAVLRILSARGIEVSDDIRDLITGCTDLDQLDAWIERAATAEKIQDLDDRFVA